MRTRGTRYLLALFLFTLATPAWSQTKMTIATGVDPVSSAYYVAQEEGLFKKNGLDVRINTGPSGSAMVAFLVNGQIESAFGSEIAGIAKLKLTPADYTVVNVKAPEMIAALDRGNIVAYAVCHRWVSRGPAAV